MLKMGIGAEGEVGLQICMGEGIGQEECRLRRGLGE